MPTYCGYIALVGRPNVGKSTLLNQILQMKLSITSRKPQTTRHRILGVQTRSDYQFVYVDTPGINKDFKKAINRTMNRTALSALRDVDAVVFVVDATHWNDLDDDVLNAIKNAKVPVILAINKVDKIKDKSVLLPLIEKFRHQYDFASIIPLSAKTGIQVDTLQQVIEPLLPEGPHLFDENQLTDRPVRFLCAELLREKIFRFCGQELPYSVNVEIEMFKEEGNLVHMHALIMVDKANHKRMVIGENGQKLKEMATQARLDMERLLEKKVYLRAWCKVKTGWADDERMLRQLGYES